MGLPQLFRVECNLYIRRICNGSLYKPVVTSHANSHAPLGGYIQVSVTVEVDLEEKDQIDPKLKEAIRISGESASVRIKDELSSLIPVESGGLRGSFTVTPTEEGLELRWSAKYAKYVDKGTPPHIILPKGDALKFPTSSGITFAKSVKHPGHAAANFSNTIGLAAMEILKEELRKAIEGAF